MDKKIIMMDSTKKCNIIWGTCFAVMFVLAALFFALMLHRQRQVEALLLICAGGNTICSTLSTENLCGTQSAQMLGCKWHNGTCTNA